MTRSARFLIPAFLLVGGISSVVFSQEKTIPLPEGTKLAIPANAGVSVKWVLPVDLKTKAGVSPVFDVDANGLPWFGYSQKVLANPLQGTAVEVDTPYDDFAWLSTGELIVCANGSIGVLTFDAGKTPQTDGKMPVLKFNPVLKLPAGRFSLFPGSEGVLYLLGKNESGNEGYMLRKKGEVGVIKKLLVTDKPVSAVAGDGETTYLSSGRSIVKIAPGSNKLDGVFQHSSENIKQLAYSASAGLFYTTETSVGYLALDGKAMEFVKTAKPKVRLHEQSLFVLLGSSCAVLRIDNVGKFAGLSEAVGTPAETDQRKQK
jgi:hypothetical protein